MNDLGYFGPTPRKGKKSAFEGLQVQKSTCDTPEALVPMARGTVWNPCKNCCENSGAKTSSLERVSAPECRQFASTVISRAPKSFP
jgi:hypothetical protein